MDQQASVRIAGADIRNCHKEDTAAHLTGSVAEAPIEGHPAEREQKVALAPMDIAAYKSFDAWAS